MGMNTTFSLFLMRGSLLTFSATVLMSLIVFFAIVLVGTMFAYAIYLRGIAYCGTVKASLVGVAEPISGTVISALWLGTVFSGWDLLGGALIITMMIIVALNK